jgi:hypothetical protein
VTEGKSQSITDLLFADGDEVERLIGEIAAASTITHSNPRMGNTIWVGPTGRWNDLGDQGRQLQTRALDEYRQLVVKLRVLLRGLPADALLEFDHDEREVLEYLERKNTFDREVEKARDDAVASLRKQLQQLASLHDRGDGRDVYLPDTNALLYNPALEEWRFDESGPFELVLAPSVVVELDELKVNDRNEDVREKAESLIRRIKGYRTRGELTAGVPLVTGTSMIRAFPVEPKVDESLPWLDPTNRDDRFIATALEVVRQHPRSAVTIVTRDLNLQTKAEYARFPFVEPPGDPQPQRRRRPKVAMRDFKFTGGESRRLLFDATVQNVDTKIIAGELSARIGSDEVTVEPSMVNLLVNTTPTHLRIYVPRPRLGDLVPAFNNEPTLFGDKLELEMRVDGEIVASDEWGEVVYDDANAERAALQEQVWQRKRR